MKKFQARKKRLKGQGPWLLRPLRVFGAVNKSISFLSSFVPHSANWSGKVSPIPKLRNIEKLGWRISNFLVHDAGMKQLALMFTLVLAPLSWGEDFWDCVEEHRVQIEKIDDQQNHSVVQHKARNFRLKYEPENNRLLLKGSGWGGSRPIIFDCRYCAPSKPLFSAANSVGIFAMEGKSFYFGGAGLHDATIVNGICEKPI